mmetsp:Transcript_10440/g.31466  ORF Transcript_10440/g.31466 Transcript_10440/m.31466 type:complete len:85 (-) Transcript_10440:5730-5984(-)
MALPEGNVLDDVLEGVSEELDFGEEDLQLEAHSSGLTAGEDAASRGAQRNGTAAPANISGHAHMADSGPSDAHHAAPPQSQSAR